ncbi:hypothetical protein LCGC14_1642900 [marine sediment metagenome]|uniref:Uncharacterized protein n=1 Tax=marine sediment metagenome TaxID=412755 RepID=A0A0F9HZV3_9ZZZZ
MNLIKYRPNRMVNVFEDSWNSFFDPFLPAKSPSQINQRKTFRTCVITRKKWLSNALRGFSCHTNLKSEKVERIAPIDRNF